MVHSRAPEPAPRVSVRTLGGTISMTADGDHDGATPTLGAESLMESAPGLAGLAVVDARTFLTVPGASLTVSDLLALRKDLDDACADGASGVVAVQGTDTLEESAFLLDLVWARPEPLILTGAMRTADAAGADGPANLLSSVAVAADVDARGRGSLVVMSDQIHDSRFVRKLHTSRIGAFGSPGAGPAGIVHEGRARFHRPAGPRSWIDVDFERPVPRVALLRLGLDADTFLLETAVERYDAVVVEALGGGHVPAWWVDPLARAAERMPVVLASRSGSGHVLRKTYDFPGSEQGLLRSGLISGGDLDGLKARILMTVALMSTADGSFDRKAFDSHARADVSPWAAVPIT